jgi:hypothetical protein
MERLVRALCVWRKRPGELLAGFGIENHYPIIPTMLLDSIPQFTPMPNHRAAFPKTRIPSLPTRGTGMKFDMVHLQIL